jgi:hypothetical protein
MPLRAVLTQDAVARLPRVVLMLLAAVYVAPGYLFRGEPWKSEADAFGRVLDILAGTATDANLAHWLAAASAYLLGGLGGFMGVAQASRLPFMLLLAASFALVWYACYHFARGDDAQPAALPFGGEPNARDFARTVADGCLLTLIACLGLGDRGHQAIPEVAQLACVALLLFGLSRVAVSDLTLPNSQAQVRYAALWCGLGLALLAACGAPRIALALSVVAGLLAARLPVLGARKALRAAALFGAVISALAWAKFSGSLTAPRFAPLTDVSGFFSLAVWFWWPQWLIIAAGFWGAHGPREARSGGHAHLNRLGQWHVIAPLCVTAVVAVACFAVGVSDQILLLSLPGMAILAANSLPFLRRTALAVIDWFALFFFSFAALFGWVLWSAWQFRMPAKPAANLERLYPGLEVSNAWPLEPWAFAVALLGTFAWLGLAVWRTSRVKHPLWKGVVLSAAGVTLFWLLLNSLNLPLLHYSRSYLPVAASVDAAVPDTSCIRALQIAPAPAVLIRHLGNVRWGKATEACEFALLQHTREQNPSKLFDAGNWQLQWSGSRPSEKDETFSLFRRKAP